MNTCEQYAQKIKEAVESGDVEYLNLVSQIIVMAEESKQVLRVKGYGWTGLDLLKTVELVPNQCEE